MGLQKDVASCGFWSLLFAWAILLDFDIQQPLLSTVDAIQLKQMFSKLWVAYVTEEGGLPMQTVQAVFAPFAEGNMWDQDGDLVSASPLHDCHFDADKSGTVP